MFATYIGHHRGGRGTEIERRGRVVGSGDDFYLADRQRDDTDSSWSCMIHLGVSPCVCECRGIAGRSHWITWS